MILFQFNFLFSLSERFENSSCETSAVQQHLQHYQSTSHSHKFQHQTSVTSSSSIQTVIMNQSVSSNASSTESTGNVSTNSQSQISSNGNLSTVRKNSLSPPTNRLSVSSAEEPLCVGDVAELLHPQYAILTGGRSRDGCPLITFPDHNNFHLLSDIDYQRLVSYLCSVPS